MGDENLYVYGITHEPPETLDTGGVDGATSVYTVPHRTDATVVGDVGILEPEESQEAHEQLPGKAAVIR